jgi:DnaA family protein
MHPQIPLPFKPQDEFNFNNFIATGNELIVESLNTLESDFFIYIWGDNSTGKTHLLQATCQQQTQQGKTACYLPLKELHTLPSQILDGMDGINTICIDDIQLISSKKDWEESLFNVFNQIKQNGKHLIISSTQSPQQLDIQLNDLKSRLNSGLALNLAPLDDESTVRVLQNRALTLGLELNLDTANYMVTRLPRDLASLSLMLEKLDKACMVEQRKLTIPFLKNTLQL